MVVVVFVVVFAIRRLVGGVGPAATNVDAALETMTLDAFPPLVPMVVGRGHAPLAAWTDLLLRRSCNDLTLSRDWCVLCNYLCVVSLLVCCVKILV